MSDNKPYSGDQEIDLSDIKRNLGKAAAKVNNGIYRVIRMLLRNAIALGVLFALGVGLGIWMDSSPNKAYNNAVIVTPNFGSVDYLYDKISLLNSKIKEGDTVFLRDVVKISKPKRLTDIEIEPITDVYPFVNQSPANFELLKLMAENGDVKKIIQEPATSKNFQKHVITFSTLKRSDRKLLLEPILAYLNESDYYKKLQSEYLRHLETRILATEQTVNQINGILDGFAANTGASGKSSMVYINENTQLNDVVETKSQLVYKLGEMRTERVTSDKIIKEVAAVGNLKNQSITNGGMKIVLPFLFMGLYLIGLAFVKFYKKQSALEKEKQLQS